MSKQGLSNKLNWNSFQSKLGGCGYSNTELSKLYSLYKLNKISDKDLEKCDLLDPYLKMPLKKIPTKISNILNQPDEVLFVMTDSMSIKEITALCKSNKKLNLQLCDNDKFWARRLQRDYKTKWLTAKQIYKKLYKPEYMYVLMTDYDQDDAETILIGVYKTLEKALERAKYFFIKWIEAENEYEDLDVFIKKWEGLRGSDELTHALGRPMKTKKDFDDVFTSQYSDAYYLLTRGLLFIDKTVKGELYDFKDREWNPLEYLYNGINAILKGKEFKQEDEYPNPLW